jgi:nucleotide-binding universal stress UspA family protein
MQYRSNNILAFIQPSSEGELLFKQVLFFQQALEMRIFFYHIIDKPSFIDKIFHAQRTKNLKTDAMVDLRCFVKSQAPHGIFNQMAFRVKTGKPLPILLRQSKKGGYEFILIDKNKPGSPLNIDETDRLISRSFCPVMVCNRHYPLNEIKEIVIPIDMLQTTKKKLLWATYFARKFNAKITIVSALSLNIDERKSLVWRNSQKLKYMLTQRGIDCEVEILKAKGQEKHQVILDFIHQRQPGLVIIRTHQESSMAGTHIGKFVSELIHGCPMPVFTVNRFLTPMPTDFDIK